MTEVPELAGEAWPEIRKIKASRNTGWEYFGNLVKMILKEIGEEKTCQILASLMAENARRYTKSGMKGFGIEGNDAWALASYFKLSTGDIIGYKTELVRESPKKVIYRLYPPCIWFPQLDIPSSLCERGFMNFELAAAVAVNPRIKVTHNKIMTAGDDCCEVVFEEVD